MATGWGNKLWGEDSWGDLSDAIASPSGQQLTFKCRPGNKHRRF